MKTSRFFITSVIISMMFFITSCYKNNDNNNNPTTNQVSITSAGYSPSSLTVVMGSTVTWTNHDNVAHTVTTSEGSINSGDIMAGSSYSKTFSTAGTYSYHDEHNTSMTGVVVVKLETSGGGY